MQDQAEVVVSGAAREVTIVGHIHDQDVGGFARLQRARGARHTQRASSIVRDGHDGLLRCEPETFHRQMQDELDVGRGKLTAA